MRVRFRPPTPVVALTQWCRGRHERRRRRLEQWVRLDDLSAAELDQVLQLRSLGVTSQSAAVMDLETRAFPHVEGA